MLSSFFFFFDAKFSKAFRFLGFLLLGKLFLTFTSEIKQRFWGANLRGFM